MCFGMVKVRDLGVFECCVWWVGVFLWELYCVIVVEVDEFLYLVVFVVVGGFDGVDCVGVCLY